MLVGCSVENYFWVILLENLVHAEVVANTCDKRHEVQALPVFHDQFLLNIVGVVFVDINDDDHLRIVLGNLAHQFATDTTTTAGHHTNLVFDVGANVLVIEFNGVSTEQVFDLDVTDLCCEVCSAFTDIRSVQKRSDKRKHFDRKSGLAAKFQNLLTVLRRATRNGKKNRFDFFELGYLRDIACATSDQDVPNILANFIAVIVDKANRIDVDCRSRINTVLTVDVATSDFVEQKSCCVTSTNNHGAFFHGFLMPRFDERNKCVAEHVTEHAHAKACNHRLQNSELPMQCIAEHKEEEMRKE